MAENIYDKGYRRILSDKRNFLDLVKGRIAVNSKPAKAGEFSHGAFQPFTA